MPFLTKEGHKTTLKIALGFNVSVNTIIVMPIIRPAKLSLDLVDNVVKSGILDTKPFLVIYSPCDLQANYSVCSRLLQHFI